MPGSIRIASGFRCLPTWRVRDGEVEEVDPRELGLSDSLASAIVAWDAEFQAIFDPNQPADSEFESAEAERSFVERGMELARLVADERQDVPEVTYFNIQSGTYAWIRSVDSRHPD